MTKNLNLFDMVKGVFTGPTKGLAVLGTVFGLAVTVFWVYAIVQFLGTTDVLMSIRWGVGLIVASIGIGLMKVWFWLMMWRA